MRAAALNEHMQADARQRHDWRAFPLQWRLVSSKHSRSWRSELVLDLERCPSERGPFCPRFSFGGSAGARSGEGDPLLENPPGARPRLGDLKPLMGLRWMTDPRTPALLLQAAVRLRPRWRLVRVLNPIVNLSASAAYGFRLSASGIALRARSRRLPKTGSHMTQRWRGQSTANSSLK